MTDQSLAIEKL